jgi:V8-like Glu-specific endopeptidase
MSIVDFLADSEMPPHAVSSGAHAVPTSTAGAPSAVSPDLPAASEAIPYPGYSDPFQGVAKRIARKVPGLRSIVRDPLLESVSGTDSRVGLPVLELSQHPASAICRILTRYSNDSKWWLGSGFLIGPGVVATAAHVLQQASTGTAVELKVLPGWNGTGTGGGYSAGPRDWRVCSNWPGSWRSDWDYGVIFLNDPNTAARHGQIAVLELPTDYWSAVIANSAQFSVSGYPIDKEGSGTQWCGKGRILQQQPHIVRHSCDTVKGHSGAPVLGAFDGIVHAIGIHSKGFDDSFNVARKLNADFRADVARWTGTGLVA